MDGEIDMIEVNIDASPFLIKDDFYLQWSHIYWWQVKLNMDLMVGRVMKEIMSLKGDVE